MCFKINADISTRKTDMSLEMEISLFHVKAEIFEYKIEIFFFFSITDNAISNTDICI